jgi:peptidoglycan/LPS O-acetylase OafA/YrhL
MKTRIAHLDSLRGIAILLVIGYHVYVRWANIVPYGNSFSDFPLFKYGYIGVQLFFIISGFVIFLSLDKTPNIYTFIYKRWLRLFPAMLVASILIYLSSSLLLERPAGKPTIDSLIPGLTFIDPRWWSFILSKEVIPLEGVFWSLYVEFKFYLFAAFTYFVIGRRYFLPFLTGVYLTSILFLLLSLMTENNLVILFYKFTKALSFQHFGWFATGAYLYEYLQTRKKIDFKMAMLVGITSSIFMKVNEIPATFAALCVLTLFTYALFNKTLQNLISNKFFMFIGYISYPLYLIHENATISMIVQFEQEFQGIPNILLPTIPITLLIIVAYIITTYIEPFFHMKIACMIKKTGDLVKSTVPTVIKLWNFKGRND